MRASETSESKTSESETIESETSESETSDVQFLAPPPRARFAYTNESHTTARVERELERGCDQKEHVCVRNYDEKSWAPRFAMCRLVGRQTSSLVKVLV